MKCRSCGFSENENLDQNCRKCGSQISVVPKWEPGSPLENKVTILKSTNRADNESVIQPNLLSKKSQFTRILETDKAEVKEPVLETKVEKISVPLKRSGTLFLNDFDISKEIGVKFELIQIGEDESNNIKVSEKEIDLSRKDIDVDDMSISSSNHVRFYKKEGKWFMKNMSSNGALFIRVKDEVALEENDIIIVGRKKTFLFKPREINE